MTISIGGKDIVLNFGVIRFYNLFKEATGKDLLTFREGFDVSALSEVTQGLIYAGYYSECKLNKSQPEFTKDEIFEMVLDSDTDFVSKIFEDYQKMMSSGEQNGQLKGELVLTS